MSNVLITGGAGFIGSNLARHHIEKKNKVWIIDNLTTGRKENLHNLHLYRLDAEDLSKSTHLQEAVNWADKIFHMAAIVGMKYVLANPIKTLQENIHGCERILEAASCKKPKVLIASSSSVYSRSAHKQLDEEDILKLPSGAFPQDSYSLSKLVNEVTALNYKHCIPVVIARIFNTVGVKQLSAYGMVLPTFVQQALRGDPITVFGNGKQIRSFCDVRDTITALDLLMESPHTDGQIVNVGNDHEISILNLAKLVKKKTNSLSPITFIPYEQAYGVSYEDVHVRKPSLAKLKKLTGFKPIWTLEQTIETLTSSNSAISIIR